MDIWLFIKGLLIGLSIAAPVGPIGFICIRSTLLFGRKAGIITGIGAASADGVYGIIAGFGLTAVSRFLIGQQHWIHLIGGVFLIYLGVKTLLSRPPQEAAHVSEKKTLAAFASVFALTLSNPMTILSFIGIFAGLGASEGDRSGAIPLVIGVFFGSALWWIMLSAAVHLFKSRINSKSFRYINWISGGTIAGFGLYTLITIIS